MVTGFIEKLVHGGLGLLRPDPPNRKVSLVPFTIPGERVRARATRSHRKFDEAVLEQVDSPSPSRIAPQCAVFGKCGGCQFQHLTYAEQLTQKRLIIEDTLHRVGRINLSIEDPIASRRPFGYRRRIRLRVRARKSGVSIGFYEARSHVLVDIESCPIGDPIFRPAIEAIRGVLKRNSAGLAPVYEIEMAAATTGQMLIRYHATVMKSEDVDFLLSEMSRILPNCVGQIVSFPTGDRRIVGQPYLMDRTRDLMFRISDQSFSQPNWEQAEEMMGWVSDRIELGEGRQALDLYCGIGIFSLALCQKGWSVQAVDENSAAILDARESARLNDISAARFGAATVLDFLRAVPAGSVELILLDPPREGAGRPVIDQVTRINPRRILYVSCDPATLARDLRTLLDVGYELGKIRAFDAFPQTFHIEAIADLHRNKATSF